MIVRLLSVLSVAAILLGSNIFSNDARAEITAEKNDDGVVVKIDGQPFAEYLTRSGNKPIVWPIIGPSGKPVTRAYPMTEGDDTEHKDHPHHRSLWFTHGDVNGFSFWHESNSFGKKIRPECLIRHREFVEVHGGPAAVITTRNDWLDPEGKKVCEDERTLTFGAKGDARWIDFDITLKATEGPVKFGDTKEGTFGVRVAGPMKVDAKKDGHIVNSHGDVDKKTWGKQSPWVDYYGPTGDETVGIAIMNHPSSFRFPTYWHVRTYGLFAANPFGLHDFKGDKNLDGSHTLAKGDSITLRYRVYLHRGDEKQGKVAAAYEAYSKAEK